ncbi:M15 family metallopeptidase [Microbacterium sulfonylureivorans]|uniref:M15 family metallopeptidase n=1 Tax=Microbacterium sulfonylureivorans TaxID=2486854 RepID=UPI000FD9376E|nr:M15 family metallopeptidase [Microbacterium sulfonylureivorans]
MSRRAARALREEADRRAREAGADDGASFVPPDDPTALELAMPLAAASPFHLPAEFRAAVAASAARQAPPASASEQPRPRPGRTRQRPDRGHSARRAARAELLLSAQETDGPAPRHARPRRLARTGVVALIAVGGMLLLGSAAAMTAMVSGAPDAAGDDSATRMDAGPQPVAALPVPVVEQTAVSIDICDEHEVMTALEAHDDAAAIAAAGGAEAFRIAVAEGHAPCVDLSDPTRVWTVVNKARPYTPVDYRPSDLVMPDGVRSVEGGSLRSDAASALTSLVTGAREAGVGEVALESGFRSYQTQEGSYGRQVDAKGVEEADLVSARPGFSEHQSGLAGDVVACAGGCGTLDDLAATPQGEWVAAHAWEHGWIVRYVEGATDVTGYSPEPWHLRYIGPELARAYHDGGWTSLEDFFGLEAAPGYVG